MRWQNQWNQLKMAFHWQYIWNKMWNGQMAKTLPPMTLFSHMNKKSKKKMAMPIPFGSTTNQSRSKKWMNTPSNSCCRHRVRQRSAILQPKHTSFPSISLKMLPTSLSVNCLKNQSALVRINWKNTNVVSTLLLKPMKTIMAASLRFKMWRCASSKVPILRKSLCKKGKWMQPLSCLQILKT